MKISRFKSLTQLTYMPKVFPVNVYLVEEAEGLSLIDTGIAAMMPEVIQYIKEQGKPLTRVILTHCHGDHIGGLESIVSAFPEVQLFVSERESLLLKGDFELKASEPQLPLKGGLPKKPVTLEFMKVDEGMTIGGLKVLMTPGHTPGSMSLYHELDGYMVVGDALQMKGGLAVAGQMNWTFPFPAMATWSKALAIESAEKIAAAKPMVIGSGHGDLLMNAAPVLSQYLQQLSGKE